MTEISIAKGGNLEDDQQILCEMSDDITSTAKLHVVRHTQFIFADGRLIASPQEEAMRSDNAENMPEANTRYSP